MKIGILGPVVLEVNIDTSSKEFVSASSANSSTKVGGPYVDLAKKLVEDGNEVVLLTELGNQVDPYIIRMLEGYGIDCSHIVNGTNGLVFCVNYNDGNYVCSHYSTDSIHNHVLDFSDKLLKELDVLIFSYIDKDVLDAFNDNNVETIWYASDEDVENWDYADIDTPYIKDVKHLTVENYKEVLQ